MIGFVLLPFFTAVLNPKDYGVSALINLTMAFAGGLFTLGTGVSVGKRYFENEEATYRESVIWTAMAMLGINATLLFILVMLFSEHLSVLLFGSSEFTRHLQLAFFVLAVTSAVDPVCILLRVTNRASIFVSLTVLNTAITAGAGVVFVIFMKRGLLGLYEAGAVAALLYVFSVIVVGIRLTRPGFDCRHVWPMLCVGTPLIVPVLGWYVIEYGDRYLIERFVGLDEVGVYTVGYTFGAAILVVVNAFYGSWPGFFLPFMNKREEAIAIFGKVFSYYTIGVGILCVGLFLAANPVIRMMTAEPFHGADTVVGLIGLAYLLKGCYLILLPGLVFASKTRLQSMIELSGAALNIGVNLLLIPVFRKEGAALATVLAFVWMCAMGWRFAKSELPVIYEWRRLGIFAGLFTICAALSFVSFPTLGLTIAMHVTCFLVFLLAAWQFVLTVSERAVLVQMLPGKMAYSIRL
jgi:O-antigen/teichoic acid export membrane protein